MNFNRWIFLASLLAGVTAAPVASPSRAFAQDDGGFSFDEEEVPEIGDPMDFSEEEIAPEDEEWVDEEEDDGFSFGEEEVVPVRTGPPHVTGLFVPTDALAPELADQLTQTLMTELSTIDTLIVDSNDGLRQEFMIMGAELAYECAFDPVCLGRYGRQLSLDKIVVGRVVADEDNPAQWNVTIDLFDTTTSSIGNYRYFETANRLVAVNDELPDQVQALFDIRQEGPSGPVGPTGPSMGQKIAAWSCGGLGVVSFVLGAVFGMQANSIRDDIETGSTTTYGDGQIAFERTQAEASDMIDDGKSKALLSNIFFGTGVALGGVSALLFLITPGQDIDESAEDERSDATRPRFQLTPSVSADGLGLLGEIRF